MSEKTVIFIVCLIITPLLLNAQNQWEKQNYIFPENLYKVIFTDSLHGWIIGDSAVIYHTFDGGENWSVQYKNPQDYIKDIYFINNLTGWAIIWRSYSSYTSPLILSTTNAGNNWTQNLFNDTVTLPGTIYFLNQNTGFIGCAYSQSKIIKKTTNGGAIWNNVRMDSLFIANFPVRTMNFIDSNTGFAAGGYYDMCGVIWKTTDGGEYWSVYSVGSEPLNSISFPDYNTIIISGGDYEFGVSITTSTDRGVHWKYNLTGYFGIGYSVSFRTHSDGWISSGFSQKFLHTSDAGENWIALNTPDSSAIYSVCFPDESTGWAVGDSGSILKYTYDPIFISEDGHVLPTFKFSAYPNPFNSEINFEISLKKSGNIKLLLYDITGKKIATILNGYKREGIYILNYNASNLSAGIYFAVLISENEIISDKKIILLK